MKRVPILIVSLLFSPFITQHPGWTSDLFVASGANGTGSSANPFGTIQEALDTAQPGDDVIIKPGTYDEIQLRSRTNGTSGAKITLKSQDGLGSVTITPADLTRNTIKITHSHHTLDGLIFNGQYQDQDTVLVESTANFLTIKNTEIKRSSKDCIDMRSPDNVLIENALIHHCLKYDPTALEEKKKRIDAHGIAAGGEGRLTNLTIRNTEIHTFSGDAVQVDPNRNSLGWDNVVIEDCKFWLAPLANSENGFPAGLVPGENAVDTKTHTSAPRSNLIIRNVEAYGYENGLIGNMAAFNIKNDVNAIIDRVTVYDSEIAFRLRGPRDGWDGANVTVTNSVVYDVEFAMRYEDNIAQVNFWNNTLGIGVQTAFQAANSHYNGLNIRNTLILGNSLPTEASHSSNLMANASDFKNAASHDYELVSGVSAVDAGVTLSGVSSDKNGISRPRGNAFDVGAYESNFTGTPTKPPTGGGSGTHDYFDALVARSDLHSAYSLRDQAQLDQYHHGTGPSNAILYDSVQDAAKVIIPEGDGVTDANVGGATTESQVRLPLGITNGTTLLTWDAMWPAGWEVEPAPFPRPSDPSVNNPGVRHHKTFQIAHRPNGNQHLWFEVRNRFDQANAPDISKIDVRPYYVGLKDPQLGPNTLQGAGGRIEPHLNDLTIKPSVWVRYWVQVEIDQNSYERVSFWVADETTDPVQILNRIEMESSNELVEFYLEYNSSQPRAPGAPELHAYVRNLAILHNPGNITSLLIKPNGGTPHPSGTLPTPTLNLPQVVGRNGTLEVSYPEGYNVQSFNWVFAKQVDSQANSIKGSPLFIGTTVASLTTPNNRLNLASQSLETGYYSVTVKAVIDGALTQPANAFVSIVNSGLESVRMFPNPWRSDKHGSLPISFDSLPIETTIKIFTIAGEHVVTLPAQSGENTWDLKDKSGNPAASGIYIYSISSSDGGSKNGRFAVVR